MRRKVKKASRVVRFRPRLKLDSTELMLLAGVTIVLLTLFAWQIST